MTHARVLPPQQSQCGVDYSLVARAPAQIARQGFTYLSFGQFAFRLRQKLFQRHKDSRRAISALQPVMLGQSDLEITQLSVLRETLHGFDPAAVRLNRKQQARSDGDPIDQNSARPANAMLATDVGPGQVKLMTKEVGKVSPRFHRRFKVFLIDRQFD